MFYSHMRKDNIICIDLLAYSSTHTSVNSFWLDSILKTSDNVTFICEEKHWHALSGDFSFCKTILFKFRCKIYWYLVRDLLFFLFLIFFRKKNIIIFGMTGTMVFLLSLFERFYPKILVTAVLHSEVEGLINNNGINRFFCRLSLKYLFFPNRVHAFVLGKHIYNNLKHVQIHRKNLYSLELPVPIVKKFDFSLQTREQINIAIIGVLNHNKKDFKTFTELANYENVNCFAIGRVVNNFRCPNVVTLINSKQHFSKMWMIEKLKYIDFLFLSPLSLQYKFTALGTIADGLEYGKFIAWVKHPSLVHFESCPLSIVGSSVQDLYFKIKNFKVPSQESIYSWFRIHNSIIRKKFLRSVEM